MTKDEIGKALDEISDYFYGCYRNAGGGTRACEKFHDWMSAVQEAKKLIKAAPTVGGWVSVKDRLPEETESMFARFHATEKWSRAMWKNESETVLVYVRFPDGGSRVTVGRLHDGKWKTTVSDVLPHDVTHWMPLPEPPKGE